MPNSMCVIILAAGVGKRMKTYGPKCTIEIGSNETVISRQIRLMKKSLPNYEILVVVGFQKAKVLKIIDVDFIENKKYEFTNTCVSVNIAIKNKKYSKILIVYGDIVFTNEIFLNMPNESWVAIDNEKNQRSNEVGINIVDDYVTHFSYGVSPKWGHVAMLMGKELLLYENITSNISSNKKFCFEIFNEIMECGGKFKTHSNKNWKMVEIDTSKDIDRAIKLTKRD